MSNQKINSQPHHRLYDSIKTLPKVELHRHLEGSLRLSTLAEIADAHGLDIANSYTIEELRPMVQMVDGERNFQTFLAKFAILRRFYTNREAISRIAYEVVADAAADNVRYMELRFNPVAQAASQGFALDDVTRWIIEAVHQAEAAHPIQVRLIIQMGRHEPKTARELAELALAYQADGIVGIDLAGDEENYNIDKFVKVMHWAKSQGLHITAHAGECRRCSPRNIQEAIEVIHADRIGHGVQAMRSPKVMQLLQRTQVPMEMCPTSNFQTFAVDSFYHHPLYHFHKQGIKVTLNTDDPSVSNITLSDEYLVAMKELGIPYVDLKTMVLNACEATFLPDDEKHALIAEFNKALSEHPLNHLQVQ